MLRTCNNCIYIYIMYSYDSVLKIETNRNMIGLKDFEIYVVTVRMGNNLYNRILIL